MLGNADVSGAVHPLVLCYHPLHNPRERPSWEAVGRSLVFFFVTWFAYQPVGPDKKDDQAQQQMFPGVASGKGPKELAGLYEPSAFAIPEQEHDDDDYDYEPNTEEVAHSLGMKIMPTFKGGSLEDSVIAEFDGIQYIIPMQVNGQTLSEEDAIARFKQTHEHYGGFSDLEQAESFRGEFASSYPQF